MKKRDLLKNIHQVCLLHTHSVFLKLVFVITSKQMVDIIVAALTFDAFLSLNGEKKDFQKKWGPKTWQNYSLLEQSIDILINS